MNEKRKCNELEPLPYLFLPQNPPLPDGEFLGCTCPTINKAKITKENKTEIESVNADAIICVVDGRFHLDASILSNPLVPCFRFDPSTQKLSEEKIDLKGFSKLRKFDCEYLIIEIFNEIIIYFCNKNKKLFL